MNRTLEKIPYLREDAMEHPRGRGFLSRYFIFLLLAAYGLAAIFPSFGNWVRSGPISEASGSGEPPSPSLIMLALLLFNAGLGLGREQITPLLRRPLVPIVALGITLCIPVGLLLTLFLFLPIAAPGELGDLNAILVGLTLVAAMPIANASAAWTQNADANMAVSLGLVCSSTFLAPVTAPLVLPFLAGFLAPGHQEALNHLANSFGGSFVFLWVILPTTLGIVVRAWMGPSRTQAAAPYVRSANAINLLALNYTHASAFLPRFFSESQFRLLAETLAAALLYCISTSAIGWMTGRLLKAEPPERIAVMFAVGMKNNGVALVLASLFMADYPTSSLTIVFCTLCQHLVAAGALSLCHSRPQSEPTLAPPSGK
jgi:bile acid:Na+ symporter, BASS family